MTRTARDMAAAYQTNIGLYGMTSKLARSQYHFAKPSKIGIKGNSLYRGRDAGNGWKLVHRKSQIAPTVVLEYFIPPAVDIRHLQCFEIQFDRPEILAVIGAYEM